MTKSTHAKLCDMIDYIHETYYTPLENDETSEELEDCSDHIIESISRIRKSLAEKLKMSEEL